MRIGVLGTGTVGETLATRLVELGHEVMLGSRTADNPKAVAWSQHRAPHACTGTFAEAASYGAFVIHAVSGAVGEQVLRGCGAALAGKVVIDVANPLDFSGDAVSLSIGNTDSLAETLQRAVPEARIVKALNTVNTSVMTRPGEVPGDHVTFIASDDDAAKDQVAELLQQFGWPAERIVDLGGLNAARALEGYLPLWLRLMGHVGHAQFNIAISAAPQAPGEAGAA